MKKLAERILCATDFSAGSFQAFQYGLEWANACEADFDIIHTMSVLPRIDTGSEVCNRYIAEQEKHVRSDLEKLTIQAKKRIPSVHSHLVEGIAEEEISKFALDAHSDLVVTGTHGRASFDRAMVGSVAERVICQAPCPVLCVRSTENGDGDNPQHPGTSYGNLIPKNLLLPIDFSDSSLEAFEYAMHLAKWFDSSITLLHAVEPLPYSVDFNLTHPIENRQLREQVQARLSELTDLLKREGLTADYQVKGKHTTDAIVEGLADTGADLIVMGTHGHQGLRRLLMGSVAASVLRETSCPILTVKSPKFASQHQRSANESSGSLLSRAPKSH